MLAHLMYDGSDDNLFDHFSIVAQRLRVYIAKDYANILEFLVGKWNVKKLIGFSGDWRKSIGVCWRVSPKVQIDKEKGVAM